MKHEHCPCHHENVKFCLVCSVVYCENCGKEWQEKQVFAYPTITTATYAPNNDWKYCDSPACTHEGEVKT